MIFLAPYGLYYIFCPIDDNLRSIIIINSSEKKKVQELRLLILIDVAAKFATQWANFCIIPKVRAESYVATEFQPDTTFLTEDIEFFLKMSFFGIFQSVTLFLNTLSITRYSST